MNNNKIIEYVYNNYEGNEKLNLNIYKEETIIENITYKSTLSKDNTPWLYGKKDSYSDALNKWLIKKNIPNNELWKKAKIDRRVFSKIYNGQNPSKNTAILIGLALELNIEDFLDLLNRAGYTLSNAIVEDLVIKWHIENYIYDINDIWEVFNKFNLKNIL